MVIELRVGQFWSEVIRVISKSNERANFTPLSSITIINNFYGKYHGNLYILIPLNQRLALTRLRATGPSFPGPDFSLMQTLYLLPVLGGHLY